jgi:hypothetical protein
MNDMAKQVGLCATGHGLEEVPLDDRASFGNATCLQTFTGSLDNMAKVKQ